METTNQQDFNKRLAHHLGELFSCHRDFVSYLMDKLNLSYEAAYRRAKGDVAFTFLEIIILSDNLQISVDSLTKYSRKKFARFDMNVITDDSVTDYISHYTAALLEPYEGFAKNCQDGKVLSSKAVHPDLPPIFLFPYRYLTKFNIFTWAYQLYPESLKEGFAGMQLPDEIIRRQDRIYEMMTSSKHHTLVFFGHNVFSSFVKRVKFFKSLRVISEQDLTNIKTELLAAVDNLEEIVKTGKYPMGNPVDIYLADIDLGSYYVYIETDISEFTIIDLYNYHSLVSSDEYVIDMHKKWGKSLKKYSTLLNGSSDVIRSCFFREQREYIEANL